jgi:hypothetical protein
MVKTYHTLPSSQPKAVPTRTIRKNCVSLAWIQFRSQGLYTYPATFFKISIRILFLSSKSVARHFFGLTGGAPSRECELPSEHNHSTRSSESTNEGMAEVHKRANSERNVCVCVCVCVCDLMYQTQKADFNCYSSFYYMTSANRNAGPD